MPIGDYPDEPIYESPGWLSRVLNDAVKSKEKRVLSAEIAELLTTEELAALTRVIRRIKNRRNSSQARDTRRVQLRIEQAGYSARKKDNAVELRSIDADETPEATTIDYVVMSKDKLDREIVGL